jgi:hypothetical protein
MISQQRIRYGIYKNRGTVPCKLWRGGPAGISQQPGSGELRKRDSRWGQRIFENGGSEDHPNRLGKMPR